MLFRAFLCAKKVLDILNTASVVWQRWATTADRSHTNLRTEFRNQHAFESTKTFSPFHFNCYRRLSNRAQNLLKLTQEPNCWKNFLIEFWKAKKNFTWKGEKLEKYGSARGRDVQRNWISKRNWRCLIGECEIYTSAEAKGFPLFVRFASSSRIKQTSTKNLNFEVRTNRKATKTCSSEFQAFRSVNISIFCEPKSQKNSWRVPDFYWCFEEIIARRNPKSYYDLRGVLEALRSFSGGVDRKLTIRISFTVESDCVLERATQRSVRSCTFQGSLASQLPVSN